MRSQRVMRKYAEVTVALPDVAYSSVTVHTRGISKEWCIVPVQWEWYMSRSIEMGFCTVLIQFLCSGRTPVTRGVDMALITPRCLQVGDNECNSGGFHLMIDGLISSLSIQ